jgi:hypothetical protein
LLSLDQFPERVLVAVFEFFRAKMTRSHCDDVRSEVQRFFRNSLIPQVTKIVRFLTDFVGIAERYAQKALTMRLDRNDMLSCGKYHPSERDPAFLLPRGAPRTPVGQSPHPA